MGGVFGSEFSVKYERSNEKMCAGSSFFVLSLFIRNES
ncbi:hypothetical protein CHCC14809_3976 [Bacillus licheniformis]|nr:hypothetical protein CHCC5026_2350 [Bacillus licheniformis]TWN16376.1 hypothetical protein CHCC14564_0941 [Bacillus licheniformis LMG 17339]TWJ54602.1 hypothetical protein CHCC5024_1950 [Bacillus licheniformis]TWK74933.1 hypothetical protein CHCC20339_4334 [Bacillus licheniformis]TWK98413.1 hypothetical protein CHCC20325_4436 [Bacillus licheniformis]